MPAPELLQEVRRRLKLIEDYYHNYHECLEQRDYSKASEYLWGIANNIASLLSILRGGKPITRHRELRSLLETIAHELALREPSKAGEIEAVFRDGILALEILHANFFHSFLEEHQFQECRRKAETLIKLLEEEVYQQLHKLHQNTRKQKPKEKQS